MSEKKQFEYDLIRCVAICCVVLYHFNDELIARAASSSYITYFHLGNVGLGAIGVSLFLIMSGALSYMSFKRCLEMKENDGRRAVISYYKKRFLALFPMFWVTILLACLLFWVPAGQKPGKDFLLTLSGMGGYLSFSGIESPFTFIGEWYQGMIIILYLLFPLIFLSIRKMPKRTFAVLSIYIVIMVMLYPFGREKSADFLIRIYDFTLGAYILLFLPKTKITGIVSLIIFVISAFVRIPFIDNVFLLFIQGISLFIFLYMLGGLLSRFTGKITTAVKRLISLIAEYSYAIFLVQHLILFWALTPFSGKSLGMVKYFGILAYICILMAVTAFGVKAIADRLVNIFKK